MTKNKQTNETEQRIQKQTQISSHLVYDKVAMQSSEKRMIFLLNGTVYVENPNGFTDGKN